ncbi:MAG: L-fucose:H+ symporter permease [Gammaproteobacteria bacterium]
MKVEADSQAKALTSVGRALAVRTAWLPLVLIVGLFFLWGMANNLNDILIKQFKKAFELSDFGAGLVQSAFYLGYFVFAIPAGNFMRRYGYKGAVVLGLLLYATGAWLFFPAAAAHTYALFLIALFVLASGLAFLETSANPLVMVLGPADTAARRLNLAQAFNPVGSIAGILIGRNFIFSGTEYTPEQITSMSATAREAYYASQSAAVQVPYLVIGAVVLLWGLAIAFTAFPATARRVADSVSGGRHLRRLLGNGHLMLAVAAQFFYVGAQVGIWSYLIRYAQGTVPGTPERLAADYLTASLVAFMVGRFVGAYLMRYLAPERILFAFAAINIALCSVAVTLPGRIGLYAVVASSFFMSVMFPTIFALGIGNLDDGDRKLGSSLIVMAIIGGAVITALMGALSDFAGIHWAMAVPLVCFAFVGVFSRRPHV